MKRLFLFIAVALFAGPLVGPSSAQQVPGSPGFDRLLCTGLASGLVEIVDDDDAGTAIVNIYHGNSGTFSTHTVYYQDTQAPTGLSCGDTVLGIE